MLILNQNAPKYRDLPYGKATVGDCGCEAIAVNNALQLLGCGVPFEDIISDFEALFKKGGGLYAGGRLGAMPRDVRRVLESCGLKPTGGFLKKLSEIKTEGVFIISYWNKPVKYGLHTVAVRFDGSTYTAYNLGGGEKESSSLLELIPDKKHFFYGFYMKK